MQTAAFDGTGDGSGGAGNIEQYLSFTFKAGSGDLNLDVYGASILEVIGYCIDCNANYDASDPTTMIGTDRNYYLLQLQKWPGYTQDSEASFKINSDIAAGFTATVYLNTLLVDATTALFDAEGLTYKDCQMGPDLAQSAYTAGAVVAPYYHDCGAHTICTRDWSVCGDAFCCGEYSTNGAV